MARLAALAALVFTMACSAAAQENMMTSNELRPARDGNIAVQEELDAARRTATIEAYDLFLARHADHPLAETARRERARLASAARRN